MVVVSGMSVGAMLGTVVGVVGVLGVLVTVGAGGVRCSQAVAMKNDAISHKVADASHAPAVATVFISAPHDVRIRRRRWFPRQNRSTRWIRLSAGAVGALARRG